MFEIPDTAKNDSVQIPRLIAWISKNPHLPGDNHKNEDYRKTLLWLVPGKAIKGTITQGTDGSLTFDGEFSTPRSPNGKPANQLDDTEKDNLKALLRQEQPKANELERKRFPGLEEERRKQKEREEKKRPR